MNNSKSFEEVNQKVYSRNALTIEDVTNFCKHTEDGLQTLKNAGYPIKDCTFKDGEWRVVLTEDPSMIAVEVSLDDFVAKLKSCSCIDFDMEESGIAMKRRIKNPTVEQYDRIISITAQDMNLDDDYLEIDTDYICSIRRFNENIVLVDCGESLYSFTMYR